MTEKTAISLADMGVDTVRLTEKLMIATKPNIKTLRRMEKHYGIPIVKIMPGKDSHTGETWPGIDFTYLDNIVPFIWLLGKQIKDELTENEVEIELDKADLKVVMDTVKNALDVEVKNSRRPTKRKHRKVKKTKK